MVAAEAAAAAEAEVAAEAEEAAAEAEVAAAEAEVAAAEAAAEVEEGAEAADREDAGNPAPAFGLSRSRNPYFRSHLRPPPEVRKGCFAGPRE